MARQMRAIQQPQADPAREARMRRWCLLAILGTVLFAVYVGTLAWATRQVEAGIDRSIQPLPMVLRDRPGG